MYNRLYSNDRSHERRKDVKDMVADPYQVLASRTVQPKTRSGRPIAALQRNIIRI